MENENIKLTPEIKEALVALKLTANGDDDKEYVVSEIEEMAEGCNSLAELYSKIDDAYEEADCKSTELKLAVIENDAQIETMYNALEMLRELASFDGPICALG